MVINDYFLYVSILVRDIIPCENSLCYITETEVVVFSCRRLFTCTWGIDLGIACFVICIRGRKDGRRGL